MFRYELGSLKSRLSSPFPSEPLFIHDHRPFAGLSSGGSSLVPFPAKVSYHPSKTDHQFDHVAHVSRAIPRRRDCQTKRICSSARIGGFQRCPYECLPANISPNSVMYLPITFPSTRTGPPLIPRIVLTRYSGLSPPVSIIPCEITNSLLGKSVSTSCTRSALTCFEGCMFLTERWL